MNKKTFLFFVLSAIATLSFAQELIIPKKGLIDKKLIKNQQYTMNWDMLKDSSRINIGQVKTSVEVKNQQVLVITQVNLKGAKSPWVDSTLVNAKDLSPIYHSSYNAQRDMVLHFNDPITGYYLDHANGERSAIQQTVQQKYFDSNFYPMLISWLPLNNHTKADINIYDYNPKGKTGLLKAHVLNVTTGTYQTKRAGARPVWLVDVSDEINQGNNTIMTYQIDQQSRQLYKQTISIGKRKMEMTLVED